MLEVTMLEVTYKIAAPFAAKENEATVFFSRDEQATEWAQNSKGVDFKYIEAGGIRFHRNKIAEGLQFVAEYFRRSKVVLGSTAWESIQRGK